MFAIILNSDSNISFPKEQSRRDGGNFRRGFPFIQKAQIRSILGKYAAERLPPLDESFQGELREWERCAGSLIGPGKEFTEKLEVKFVYC